MIDVIASKTKDIMFKCCEKYAAKNKLSIDDVQLNLALELIETEDGVRFADTYFMCQDYQKKEEYDIMKVLGVMIDFVGYSKIAPPFIVKSLIRYSEEYNILFQDVSIMCVPSTYVNEKGKKKSNVSLYLYNGKNYVATPDKDENGNEENGISFADLFRAEDFEMPTA